MHYIPLNFIFTSQALSQICSPIFEKHLYLLNVLYIHHLTCTPLKVAYSGDGSESQHTENSISDFDSDTDNDTLSYTASSRTTPTVRPQTMVLDHRESINSNASVHSDSKDGTEDNNSIVDSEDSEDVCDGRILRAYLKMLHDHLVKTVMRAL